MRKICNLMVWLAALMLVACEKQETPIVLNQTVLQMKPGEIQTVEVVGSVANVEWTSSNPEVATVYYGVVTAVAIGKTVITASAGKQSATCEVFVSGSDGATLRITPAVVSMKKGETFQFSYGNTYDLELTWSSSDDNIASVSQTGLVTANNAGNATITLATNVGSVTALVAVEHNWGEYQLVWSDEFNGSSLDESNWTPQIGGNGWGNQEAQYYTDRSENLRTFTIAT